MTIQVLTQAREHLVDKTFDALKGAKNAILHIYNSTSTLQRRVVFREDRAGVKAIATDGAKMVADRISRLDGTNLQLQYSPESFTGLSSNTRLRSVKASWMSGSQRRITAVS